MNYNLNNTARKTCLTASLVSVSSLALMATPTLAQEAPPSVDEEVEQEAIIVTGSRLKRDPNLGSASPIVSIDSDELRGGADVTETLREVERTLVLVNGRRHVAGVAESAIVDINSIPASLIENVEVLTGGASAVYGADAVTGVVNFVLQDDFDGVELGVRAGVSSEGDGDRYEFYGKFGRNFADGRGNITIAADYSRDFGLRFGDRDQFTDGNISSDGPNPFLRFQQGDLGGTSTPNFNAFFDPSNGFYPFGFSIPIPGSANYEAIFTGGVTPTADEQVSVPDHIRWRHHSAR